MRTIPTLLALSTLVCSLNPALADTLPKRQAGMWEVTIQSDNGMPRTSTKQCVDETTDAKMMKMGNDAAGSMGSKCSKNEFKKTASGFETSAECQAGSSTMVSRGIFTGDFASSYSGEVKTSFTPPMFGQETSTISIAAKFLGPCTDGLKPGDILLDNGMKTNVDTAAAQAKQAAEMFKNGSMFKGAPGGMKGLDAESMKMLENAMKQMDVE